MLIAWILTGVVCLAAVFWIMNVSQPWEWARMYFGDAYGVSATVAGHEKSNPNCMIFKYRGPPDNKLRKITLCHPTPQPVGEVVELLVSPDGKKVVIHDPGGAVISTMVTLFLFSCIFKYLTGRRRDGGLPPR